MGSVLSSIPRLTITEVASGKALDTLEAAPEEVELTVDRQKLRSRIDRLRLPVRSLSRGDFAMAS
jgi:hypothetical protein